MLLVDNYAQLKHLLKANLAEAVVAL